MADIEYIKNGIFTTFVPVNNAGEMVVREMQKQSIGKVAVVFTGDTKSIIRQLRDAGYSVAKSKPVTKEELEDIFVEMDELGL